MAKSVCDLEVELAQLREELSNWKEQLSAINDLELELEVIIEKMRRVWTQVHVRA